MRHLQFDLGNFPQAINASTSLLEYANFLGT